MNIIIGQMFQRFDEPEIALEIDGLGIFKAKTSDTFKYVEIKRESLIKLKDLIDKELSDEKGKTS